MQVPWASWAVWASWAAGFLFGSGLVNTMYYCKINVLLNKLQLNTQERKKCRHFSWYPSYGKKYHTLLLLVSDSSPPPSPGGSHHFCLWLLMQHYPFHPSLQFPAILSKCWSFHLRLYKIWFMIEDHPTVISVQLMSHNRAEYRIKACMFIWSYHRTFTLQQMSMLGSNKTVWDKKYQWYCTHTAVHWYTKSHFQRIWRNCALLIAHSTGAIQFQ